MARDLRSLANVTFEAVHKVSEGALDLETAPELRRLQFYGEQIADAGVSALAHLACANAALPPWDLQSRIELRTALNGARDCLDALRRVVRACETQGHVTKERVAPLEVAIEEAMALVRALALETRTSRVRVA